MMNQDVHNLVLIVYQKPGQRPELFFDVECRNNTPNITIIFLQNLYSKILNYVMYSEITNFKENI